MKADIRHARLILGRLKLAYRCKSVYVPYFGVGSVGAVCFLQKLQK